MSQVHGYLDEFVPPRVLAGWVFAADAPDQLLEIQVSGRAATVRTGLAREDLKPFGSGRFGFRIELEQDLAAFDLLAGRVVVTTRYAGANVVLQIDNVLAVKLTLLTVGELMLRVQDQDLQALTGLPALADAMFRQTTAPMRDVLTPVMTHLLNPPVEIGDIAAGEAPAQLTEVLLPAGLLAADGSAMLGRGGNLFITGGTNSVTSRYRRAPDDPAVARLAAAWLQVMIRRQAALAARGVQYIQAIIPEKQTLLGDLLPGPDGWGQPEPTGRPTPLLAALTRLIAGASVAADYLDVTALLLAARLTVFRKVDSHLTPFGTGLIYAGLAAAMGQPRPTLEPGDTQVTSGDLARRFFGRPIYEITQLYRQPEHVRKREMTMSNLLFDKHIGRRYSWRNPAAPIDKCVVAFGNSFMDGDRTQGSVSFWLAGNCRRYHFLFRPEMDLAIVDELQPDVVICQTVERYLDIVPPG